MSVTKASKRAAEISIIVPVYNVESFIEECLLSLIRQSYPKPYEVILIDDRSTDQSAEHCRRFVASYPEIFRLIENEHNLGVSAARNLGPEIIGGRYFMFVDPDDLLPPGSLFVLYDAAEKNQATIVKGNNTIFTPSSEMAARYNVKRQSMIYGEAILTTLYEHEKVRGQAGGKLFRREPLGKYRFPVSISMVEDLVYSCEVFNHADRLLLLNKLVYRYRNREGGATGLKFENGTFIEWLETVEKTERFTCNAKPVRAHKSLLLRTITQLAREYRHLPLDLLRDVFTVIEDHRNKWDIWLATIILKNRLGIRSISHYLKLLLAIREIKRGFTRQEI